MTSRFFGERRREEPEIVQELSHPHKIGLVVIYPVAITAYLTVTINQKGSSEESFTNNVIGVE